ncbi:Card1-like endonuclease domain-containing protein [Chakrabartyella piscis]|uniref:Card1-like endonuclease domain-containing protein n=1 Tax=Chakrabartyella piscis TaxID=2918914 RepID=UPI00295887FE|nr:DUF1887 family CARF protein [Chakrabartyella piscis]
MDTLIKFYDKDVLKNIVAPLTLLPDKMVYLYDSGMEDLNAFRSLEKCFHKHKAEMIVESHPVDIMSVESMCSKIRDILHDNDKESCSLEIVGGSELMLIAGYRTSRAADIPILHTDLMQKEIRDLETGELVATTKKLSLEDFIHAKGACFMGESHKPPAEENFASIKKMAQYLFTHLQEWKETCTYLQTIVAQTAPEELYMKGNTNIHTKYGRAAAPNIKVLRAFLEHGFITKLKTKGNHLSFTFTSLEARQYAINYGVWLELYVYVSAMEAGVFDDVKLGTMIDWDAYDGVKIGGNEIDVLLMDDSLPVFISCKLRDADTAALNELLIGKKRLGGWFSKGIIVAFGKDKEVLKGTSHRAKELGLEILDGSDILADDFAERLHKTIKGHDLVSLKWKKI